MTYLLFHHRYSFLQYIPRLLFSACLFILSNQSFADNLRVTLITSSETATYITTANSIKAILKNNESNNILIETITAEEIYSEKSTLSKSTDLFVPVGQRALKETIKYSDNKPILATLVSIYGFEKTLASTNKPLDNVDIGAVFIDQPISRHLIFSRLVLPFANIPGFIVSADNKVNINLLNNHKTDVKRHVEIVKPGDNVIRSLANALNYSDVIIALPDPIVFNLRTTRNILLSTYRKRVPVIGFSKAYAKAGALAAIYSTPELIGKQTGEVILNLSSRKFLNPLEKLHSKYFSISVNNRVSRSLGLPKLDAKMLETKLLAIEKDSRD